MFMLAWDGNASLISARYIYRNYGSKLKIKIKWDFYKLCYKVFRGSHFSQFLAPPGFPPIFYSIPHWSSTGGLRSFSRIEKIFIAFLLFIQKYIPRSPRQLRPNLEVSSLRFDSWICRPPRPCSTLHPFGSHLCVFEMVVPMCLL